MLSIWFGSMGIGLAMGLIFSLLFVTFDSGWQKVLSSVFLTGTSGTGIWYFFNTIGVKDYKEIFTSIGTILTTFTIVFVVFMFIMCKVIKDNNDNDVLRIRDIILGQKSYIQKYYDVRAREIDEKLNIEELRIREEKIRTDEHRIQSAREKMEEERQELEKIGKKKLKIKLPVNKNLTVTKEFLELFPSYVDNLSSFIGGITAETEVFIKNHDSMDRDDLKVFLKLISLHVSENLFGKGVRDVRIHFRYYDEDRDGFEKLISTIGEKTNTKQMTFIPYNKANMIMKSFECKRALIKSYNTDYDFVGNNSTTWTEYMTMTFYNITKNNKPCLSFGISVKNKTKFKNLLNFLNYCQFESYLQEVIEQIDEKYSIVDALYNT